MDILATLKWILTNPWFYGIILVLAIVSYGTIRTFFKKFPIINKKSNLIIIASIGVLAFSGMLGNIGWSSTGSLVSGNSWQISDVAVSGLSTDAGTIATDSNNRYLINARYTDAQANTSVDEVKSAVFTIVRAGELKADSCNIQVTSPDFFGNEVTGVTSATPYNIIEKDVSGKLKVYLHTPGTTNATSSDLQGSIPVAFGEGVASASFSLMAEVDETSHDALKQYSSRDVTINVCGFPTTLRVFRMD